MKMRVRIVTASWVVGLLCCLPSSNLQARRPPFALQTNTVQTNIVVVVSSGSGQTNIVIVSDGGSTTTNESVGYAGEASAALGSLGFMQGGSVSVAETTLLSLTGGAQEASELEISVGEESPMEVSHATVIGQGKVTASQASVANVTLTSCGGFFGGGTTTISADFVLSEATSACSADEVTSSGSTQISGLVINGEPVSVTGQANQFVMLTGGGFVVINEQLAGKASATANGQTVTTEGIAVNALHVVIPCAGVNVVFGSSAAGIACGPEINPVCGDFATGGGWITGTPSGAKANFGVAGGIKDEAFWGHLNYIDHGNGMHVKATAVTGYAVDPNDANCRIIDYDVTVDGQPSGIARERVCDLGEPGSSDTFEIQLSNGYYAAGVLGGGQPGGGNIQLRLCQ